jgi:hypothetical protein
MTATFTILDLSDGQRRLAPIPGFARGSTTIRSPEEVPSSTDPLVLYVVGHAVKHGLVDSSGRIRDEKEVAVTIQRLRAAPKKTLIIWDVCFAESMLTDPNLSAWPSNFVHILSCRSFERTWHTGQTTDGLAYTMFSAVLQKAVDALASYGTFGWTELERELQTRFDALQSPLIRPLDYGQPRDFEIERLLASSP